VAVQLVIPSHKFKFGSAKQTAFGSVAANPDYQTPVYSATLSPMETRNDIAVVQGTAFSRVSQLKGEAWAAGDVEWASLAAGAGRILAAHFGTSSDAITGAGDPYTHTFTRKDVQLPHTVWMSKPKNDGTFEHDRLLDCISPTLVIEYTTGQLLRLKSTYLGSLATGLATAPTPTTTETITPTGYGHTWRGATLNLDVDATPAVTAINNVQNFTLTSTYPNATWMYAQNLNPDYLDLGLYDIGFSASIILPSWAYYNATYYGAKAPGANTAQSSTVLSGSLIFTIQQEPVSANRTMVITMPAVLFEMAPVGPDPGGAGLVATVTGQLQDPGVGVEPITIAIKNAVATAFT
jgi:hypothetical protein